MRHLKAKGVLRDATVKQLITEPIGQKDLPRKALGQRIRGHHLTVFRFSSTGSDDMAEMATIEMQDRELFAAMAMQALITRGEGWAADMIAKQAVARRLAGRFAPPARSSHSSTVP